MKGSSHPLFSLCHVRTQQDWQAPASQEEGSHQKPTSLTPDPRCLASRTARNCCHWTSRVLFWCPSRLRFCSPYVFLYPQPASPDSVFPLVILHPAWSRDHNPVTFACSCSQIWAHLVVLTASFIFHSNSLHLNIKELKPWHQKGLEGRKICCGCALTHLYPGVTVYWELINQQSFSWFSLRRTALLLCLKGIRAGTGEGPLHGQRGTVLRKVSW